jgi:hypothetical protein
MEELYAAALPIVARELGLCLSLRLLICKAALGFPRISYLSEINEHTLVFYQKVARFPLYRALCKAERPQQSSFYEALCQAFTPERCLVACIWNNDHEMVSLVEPKAETIYKSGCLAIASGHLEHWQKFWQKHSAPWYLDRTLKEIVMSNNNTAMLAVFTEKPTFVEYVMHVSKNRLAFSSEFASTTRKWGFSRTDEVCLLPCPRLLPQLAGCSFSEPCCNINLTFVISNAIHHLDLATLDRLAELQPSPCGIPLEAFSQQALHWLARHPIFGKETPGCRHSGLAEPCKPDVLGRAIESKRLDLAKQMIELGFSCRLAALHKFTCFAELPELGAIVQWQQRSEQTVLDALHCIHPHALHWACKWIPEEGVPLRKVLIALSSQTPERALSMFAEFVQLGYHYRTEEVPKALDLSWGGRLTQWMRFLMQNRSWDGFLERALLVTAFVTDNLQHSHGRVAKTALKLGCPLDVSCCHHNNWFHKAYCRTTEFPIKRHCPHHGPSCLLRLETEER